MIPAGWMKCEIEEAENLLLNNGWTLVRNINNEEHSWSYLRTSEEVKLRISGTSCALVKTHSLGHFGITPIRKIKPVEFTVDGNSPIGGIFLIGGTPYMRVDFNFAGKKFREVIE